MPFFSSRVNSLVQLVSGPPALRQCYLGDCACAGNNPLGGKYGPNSKYNGYYDKDEAHGVFISGNGSSHGMDGWMDGWAKSNVDG